MIIRIVSIDIGTLNFALSVEEIDLDKLKNLSCAPKGNFPASKRYNIDGTPTPEFDKILEEVYKNGKIILTHLSSLKSDTEQGVFQNMIDCLNKYKTEFFDDADYIVIEKQMKVNQKACRLSVCCISYFVMNYGLSKKIIEFDAYYKTTILGAVKNKKVLKNGNVKYTSVDKPTRKKWAIDQAFSILACKEDYETMSEISGLKKFDDVCDTICMLQAFKCKEFFK